MTSPADPELAAALAGVHAALDRLDAVGVAPRDELDALEVVRAVERCARRLAAAQVAVVHEIDRRGLVGGDGHRAAHTMVTHAANLHPAEGQRRAAAARALADLPELAAAFRSGEIGRCQVDRIAATHRNERVRDDLIAVSPKLARRATELRYLAFHRRLADWERLADEDGARQRAERSHERRDFGLVRNLDGTRRFVGGCGALQGAQMAEVLDRYVDAEWEADWAEARARVGDGATITDLARTPGQRRMDAAARIFAEAAGAGGVAGTGVETSLVMDQPTFERNLARITGIDPGPDPRVRTWFDEPDHDRSPEDADPGVGFRCSTLDGTPIDPTEATWATLVGHVRRVVVRRDGVVLDAGRRSRLFTGPRHLAVMLSATTCYWPGCDRPVTQCQADHLEAWHARDGTGGGTTCPDNGGPLCGRHNRLKHHGFTVHRDADGTWHVHRPDGTEIT